MPISGSMSISGCSDCDYSFELRVTFNANENPLRITFGSA